MSMADGRDVDSSTAVLAEWQTWAPKMTAASRPSTPPHVPAPSKEIKKLPPLSQG